MLDLIPVGDLGKNRKKFIAKITKKAGEGNWFWVYRSDKTLISWALGLQLYEDAYYMFFRNNLDVLKEVASYYDVYVYNKLDLESGLKYKAQNQDGEHYEDVAVRRCMIRFGVNFRGRKKKSYLIPGSSLDHGSVPFHLPHLLRSSRATAKEWLYNNRMIALATTVEDQVKLSRMLVS